VVASTPVPNWPRDESLLEQIPGDVEVHRVAAFDPRGRRMRGLEHHELSFLWRRAAMKCAAGILAAHRHDVILATAPPPVPHAVASTLSRRFEVPWVADFRDPWGVRAPAIWRHWRRSVYLRNASAVVAVNETLREHLQHCIRRPVTTIFNGYEADEMRTGAPKQSRRAVFLGTISEFNDLDVFFAALSDVDGEFVHIGAARRYDLEARTAAAGLKKVTSTGYLPRKDALREAATGSLYILSLKPDLELALSAKTFDYIGLGGPILCVGENRAMVEFLRDFGDAALVVPAHDRGALAAALNGFWERPRVIPEARRAQFCRAFLARQLADVLGSVTAGGP
jgi:glycosyltransferase involved in cell wall biosynthesis